MPIAGILGDQQAALVGQTCFAPGEAKNTYGTGCFLLMNTGTQPVPSTAGLVTTVAYQLGNEPAHYALEGSIAIAGALVQWLRDNLGIIAKSADVEALAREVAGQRRRLLRARVLRPVRAVLEGERARRDRGPHALRDTSHIARAALEATAYQTRDVLDAMEQDSRHPDQELRVDGGMVVNELLMQFQADILGVPVVRPRDHRDDGARRGVRGGPRGRLLAERDELTRNWGIDKRWRPAMADADARGCIASWQKAVTRSFGWIEPRLSVDRRSENNRQSQTGGLKWMLSGESCSER